MIKCQTYQLFDNPRNEPNLALSTNQIKPLYFSSLNYYYYYFHFHYILFARIIYLYIYIFFFFILMTKDNTINIAYNNKKKT